MFSDLQQFFDPIYNKTGFST